MEPKPDNPEVQGTEQRKVGYKSPPVETRFTSCGNPKGRPKGARDKLQRDFLAAISEDFAEHGKAAIVKCREETPAVYIKVIASLMPKEIELENNRPLGHLSDEDLARVSELLEESLAREAARAADDRGEAGTDEAAGIVMPSPGTVQ